VKKITDKIKPFFLQMTVIFQNSQSHCYQVTKANSTIKQYQFKDSSKTSISYCDIINDKSQRKILAISRLATSSTNKSSILNNRFLECFCYLVAKNANLQYLKFAKHSGNSQQRANQLFFDQNDQTKRLMDLTLYIKTC
jgi:hypothetical protein